LIDDTYNANPESLQAALEVLAAAGGETWLVLGDMGELGPGAQALHRTAGEHARSAGIDRLFTLGPLARLAAVAFGRRAAAFDEPESLLAALQEARHAGVQVLVKGSRSMRMERIVSGLGASASTLAVPDAGSH
jgi:UDP-N-acetylmuramoyl-tripeptide--D-alanyl-D-alanine ligase